MIVRKEIDLKQPPSEKQLKMLKAMEERPIVFDDDSPELTAEQLSKLRRAENGSLSRKADTSG